MKQTEFDKMIDEVAQEELKRLADHLMTCGKDCDPLTVIGAEISNIAARTTREIILRAGLIQFDSEDDA